MSEPITEYDPDYHELRGSVSSPRIPISSSSEAWEQNECDLTKELAKLQSLSEKFADPSEPSSVLPAQESTASSVEDDKGGSVMSSHHKNVIQRNWTLLVENIVPNDMFNHLIAKNVLTSADVRRIKTGKTWEAMNGELLNHIVRKSDSAFSVLIESLRNTCQGHLADHLQEVSQLAGKDVCKRRSVEEIMSRDKKQVIQKNRPELVNDMTPDEIFNDLIAEKILTSAEVGRIKEKSTREAITEDLLDYIVHRSDRAFGVFVESLKKTQQEHLAKLLDIPDDVVTEPKLKKQKVNMDSSVEENSTEVNPVSEPDLVCSLEDVQQQIVLMAESAFGNIQRKDDSRAAFEQFCKEMSQTTTSINKSLALVDTLRAFCQENKDSSDSLPSDGDGDGDGHGSHDGRKTCQSGEW